MNLEREVRAGLRGDNPEYQEAAIERLRRVFDTTWTEYEFHFNGRPEDLPQAIQKFIADSCRPLIFELFKVELRVMDLETEIRRLREDPPKG